MMKKPTPFLLLALALVAVGCNTKTSKSSNSNQYNNGYTSGGYTGYTTGTTTNGTTTTGTTTNGNTTGSTTGGTPVTDSMPEACNPPSTSNGSLTCTDFGTVNLPRYEITMAGGHAWKPDLSPNGKYYNSDHGSLPTGVFPTATDMAATLQTDNILSVRFRINNPVLPSVGKEYCYGRKTGQWADPCYYSKLKFKVGAVPLSVFQTKPSNYAFSEYMVEVAVNGNSTEGIVAGKCTEFINLPKAPNVPHVIIVQDVKSDSFCREKGANQSYCPSNSFVREASCWSMTMEVQTSRFRL